MTSAIVLCGGELGEVTVSDLPNADIVIAADSGLHHASTLQLDVDLLIGDLDSVDRSLISNLKVEEFPTDKDATDLELAIDRAVELGATDVCVVGGLFGRLDHMLGNVFVLTRNVGANVWALMGTWRVYVVRDSLNIDAIPGETVSQFAIDGPVHGLTTSGLKWSGHYDVLQSGSSRGVSNVAIDAACTFTVESGTLLVLHQRNPSSSNL